ncbi:MAG: sigma 54-interacting transcriptional regulator [Syntrophales bacterium]|nr:sigma 54-interacting transcriptional regulator [Syntrophales bacterium]
MKEDDKKGRESEEENFQREFGGSLPLHGEWLSHVNETGPSKNIISSWFIDILDAIYDGILIADANTIVRYVNPEYTRITGVKPEQIIGRPLREVRPGAILPDVIRTGIPRAGVFRREGEIEYVVDMAPIYRDGKIVGGVSVLKDITEVRRLSSELKKFVKRTNQLHSFVRHVFQARYTFDDIIAVSEEMKKVVSLAKRIALGDSDVLITGESGTGKELFAQAIHNGSNRSSGPFIAFSCASLSASLVESELFGYADGAFTGARKGGKAGFFEIADGGTVFIDEVAELSKEVQAKLLRVLQERRVRRVGEAEEVEVNIRIIIATNRDLEKMVKEGKFREDLYYRLNVVNLHLPPLRSRQEDIKPLAEHFFHQCTRRLGRSHTVSPKIYEIFEKYHWPGNVRELINTVEYTVNMADTDFIGPEHLPKRFHDLSLPLYESTLKQTVRETEKKIILNKLNRLGWSVSAKKQIAKEMGISLSSLYAKLKSYGIKKEKS